MRSETLSYACNKGHAAGLQDLPPTAAVAGTPDGQFSLAQTHDTVYKNTRTHVSITRTLTPQDGALHPLPGYV